MKPIQKTVNLWHSQLNTLYDAYNALVVCKGNLDSSAFAEIYLMCTCFLTIMVTWLGTFFVQYAIISCFQPLKCEFYSFSPFYINAIILPWILGQCHDIWFFVISIYLIFIRLIDRRVTMNCHLAQWISSTDIQSDLVLFKITYYSLQCTME